MAAQAALIAETIAGMKKAISGRYSSDSDDSIEKPTNRGNKLKRKAQYMQEGRLAGRTLYKKNIDHAGYQRFIVSRNPKRYDQYGDELEEDDEDEQADAAMAESNPYGEIKIEREEQYLSHSVSWPMLSPMIDLLAPLTSAADLPIHPSMSIAYKSIILGELVQQACEMVHKERKTLWHIKTLATRFRGDQGWIPCEALCSSNDAAMFLTEASPDGFSISTSQTQSHSDKLHLTSNAARAGQQGHHGNKKPAEGNNTNTQASNQDQVKASLPDRSPDLPGSINEGITSNVSSPLGVSASDNTLMVNSTYLPNSNSVRPNAQIIGSREESRIESMTDSGEGVELSIINDDVDCQDAAGLRIRPIDTVIGMNGQLGITIESDQGDAAPNERPETLPSVQLANKDDEVEETQAPSHRMTTRAQAQAASDKAASTATRSPSQDSSVPPYIHPLYLIPSSALPDRDYGLPPAEAEETRCILMLWVQKQEEVCRGVEQLYNGLLRANRMRKTVLSWCKAEGHVGEMSDGEDWYDKEEWGLEDDLKKGQLEEEDDAGTQGKKTRGRRAQ